MRHDTHFINCSGLYHKMFKLLLVKVRKVEDLDPRKDDPFVDSVSTCFDKFFWLYSK
jgi:hypothetical protein